MRIEAGRLLVDADAAGRIVRVAPRQRLPRQDFVTAVDLGACRVAGREVSWAPRQVAVDIDEIEVHVEGTGLAITLRHGFSTGWTTRLLVVSSAASTVVVDRLQLVVALAEGQRGSALAAGARMCWAVQGADGAGPVLAARLVAGAVSGVTDEGFELGPLRLAPGQRYVVQLRWELFATPRSVVAGPGRDVLLSRTTYEVGEPALLPADPDAALVAPAGVAVDALEEPELAGREVYAVEPGRHLVELRSAEGDVRLDLSWVRPLAAQVEVWAGSVLSRRRTAAGVVAVDDLPAAIVVQAALGAGGLEDADQAADALDRMTALLLDTDGDDVARDTDPLEVLYLLGEHGRTGDADVFAAALARESALLAGDGAPPPGLGLAVLRTALAGVDAPEQVGPLIVRAARHAELASAPDASAPDASARDAGAGATGAQGAAELELLLAVRPLLPADHPTQQRLDALVRGLGAALGAGLPGRLLVPPAVAEHAHLITVLRMLPEDGLPGVTRSWGATPSLLTHRWTLEVLDRLTDADIGRAAAWLALVQRHA